MKANINRGVNHALGLYTKLLTLVHDMELNCGVALLRAEWAECDEESDIWFQRAQNIAQNYLELRVQLQKDLQHN